MTRSDEYFAIRQLLDDILKIDRNQLRVLRNYITNFNYNDDFYESSKNIRKGAKNETLELIGSLPFVLLDKKYFPDNKALVMFAEKHLDIKIKFAPKRSRNEIIGTIIAEMAEKNKKQISVFTTALNKILGKQEKGVIKNFFTEWNKVISET